MQAVTVSILYMMNQKENRMPYGTPRAVTTTFHDLTFCLKCAAYIHQYVEERRGNDFFFWLRDFNVAQIGQDERIAFLLETHFIREMNQCGVRNWLSEDTEVKLVLLLEGQDQEELNDSFCSKCLVPLKSLCTDYP